ncbi:glycosyltransferase [Rhizomonospora bruguierae]|uniref:glycosyltransferase n=1 Tax=Rhizomonospora bruguierae TaxID=1581705 RepID=UPI001BCF9F3C|nr:glycosyltransferase [Micromonospora sp. NBRC 107566]
MARFLWASFDGGGNVPPSLGVARELVRRGHEVSFAGRPELVRRMRRDGLPAIELTRSYAHADRYDWHPRGRLFAYLTSPAVGDELLALAKAEGPDVMIIDAMFGGALAAAPRFGLPTAVMLHTFLHRTIDGWRVLMADESDARARSGFDPLPPLEAMWGEPDLLHVNSLRQLDCAPKVRWPNIRHGAPILTDDGRAVPVELPWPAGDPHPVALISFSTALAQASLGKVQRSLDALADLPVHPVATVGDAIDPAALAIPANAHVVRFAKHNPLVERAALVLTHGGHGTAMRALAHGVPLVCLAGRAADQEGVAALDQPRIAAFCEEREVGRMVDADAPAERIRAAARAVLEDPRYRANARAVGALLGARSGAAEAASAVERLVR